MAPLKSLRLDGFAAVFFQQSWSTVSLEVCVAVLGFLNGGVFDDALNSTYITLIPKKKKPSNVIEFRPISLCNMLYKIIAKVIANRLKRVVPHIISPFQSAFIPG